MAKYEPKTCIKCKHRVFTNGSLRRSHWHVFDDFVIEKIDNIILNG